MSPPAWWLVPWALALFGCPSFSTMGSARVLKPGLVRLSPAVTIVGAQTDQKTDIETTQPQIEFGVSGGVVEDFELGARVWSLPSQKLFTVGAQINAKVQLFRPSDPTRGVHVALAPRLSFHHLGSSSTSAEAFTLALPLLVGITFGDDNELVVGPQIGGNVMWMQGADDVFSLTAGASVGAVLWVSECFAIVPEVSVHYSTLTAEDNDQIWFWQAGLGVVFDIAGG